MANIEVDGITFSEDRKTLIKCPSSFAGACTVPEGVTTIGNGAFNGCVQLSAIVLPHTLSSVEINAFSGCKTLNTIRYNGNLRDWLTRISWKALNSVGYSLWLKESDTYVKLTKAVIPEDVTEIRALAFYYCNSLTDVVWHDKITKIDNNSFNKSNFSSTLWVPESVTYIGNNAFLSCQNLVNVHIPESVSYIGRGCFSYCSNLFSIEVSEENSSFSTNKDGSLLYDKFQKKLLQCVCKSSFKSSNRRLSKTCREIEDFAFVGCGKFKVYLSDIQTKALNVKDCECEFMVPFGRKDDFVNLGFPKSQISEMFDSERLIKSGNEHLDIVVNNPFRILGVAGNASAREIAANCTKIKRFSAAGRKVSYPTDMEAFIGEVVRTPEKIDDALSKINLQEDKIRYALFWFLKLRESDNQAIDLLASMDFDKFVDLSYEDDNYDFLSSRYNLAIAKLVKEKYWTAIYASDILDILKNEDYCKELVDSVCGENVSYSSEELSTIVLDTLLEECDAQQLYLYYSDRYGQKWAADYVKEKVIGEFISTINAEISEAKAISRTDAKANLSAARKLISKTKAPLNKAKEFLPENDPQYEIIADSLAKQILQSGINYYNNSDDDDSAEVAYEVQSYADKIAVGSLAKGRCQENVQILKKILRSTPPAACRNYDKQIKDFIDSYNIRTIDNAVYALEHCAEYLVSIKELAGNSSLSADEKEHYSGYIESVSTNIAAKVLDDTIGIVNSFTSSTSRSQVETFIEKAWKIMCYISSMNLREDFRKNRFAPNNKTLGEMYDKVNTISGFSFTAHRPTYSLDLRTEGELYSQCPNNINNCNLYLKKYPSGIFAASVREYKESIEWRSATSISKIEAYLRSYPSGRYRIEAQRKVEEYKKVSAEIKALSSREELATAHSKYKGTYFDELVDDCYYEKCHSRSSCSTYCELFGYSGKHHSDAKKRAEKEHTVLCFILGI